jgi:glycosyltransferase involved in cell wall biosynthesis
LPVPGVVTIHDFTYARQPHTMAARHAGLMRAHTAAAVASARRVIADSAAVAREFASRYGRRADVVPLGVDPRFRPATADEVARARERHGLRKPYVLAVGTLEPRKQWPSAVRAHARLSQLNGWRGELAVAGGRGWGFDARPERDVRWLGFVDDADLPALYTGAEALVAPSLYEGFGLPLVEAMACGTPVVCSDIPVFREVAGDAATYSAAGDADAMAASLNDLLHDDDRRRALSERGLLRARDFSWDRTADRTLEVLVEAAR